MALVDMSSQLPAGGVESGGLKFPGVVVVGGDGSVPADDLAKVQSTNSTDASFPALVPTTTQPTASATRAVLTWAGRSTLFLIPYGTGADNATITGIRVVGWQKVSTLWVPVTIAIVSATLCTITGESGATIGTSERFCDTLSLTAGVALILSSVADNANVAAFVVGVDGFDLVEVQFDLGTATAANCLYNTL